MRPLASLSSLVILTFALLTSGCETTDRALTAAERVMRSRTGQTVIDLAEGKDPAQIAKKRFDQYARDPEALLSDLRAAKKDFETILAALGVNVGKTWGKKEVQLPERKKYVKYTQNYKSRAIVDFDSGETTAPVLVPEAEPRDENFARTREKLRTQLRSGKLDNRLVEMEVREKNFPTIELAGPMGVEEMGINMKDMLGNLFQGRSKRRKMRVDEAMDYLMQEEEERLIDMDAVARASLERVESSGIIFLDEIDKIAGRESGHGPDVSREGVQRDILPIVEGTTVNTRYGMVRTDHVLFIAAGAFHVSKPSDLIPELQGRFPIRVELESLTIEDFKRILTEPKNSLVKQYRALMETEGVKLDFTVDAIDSIANFAARVNQNTEDIGARRLHTIMERLLDEISFEGPDLEPKDKSIDAAYVELMLSETVKDQDLSRYIL